MQNKAELLNAIKCQAPDFVVYDDSIASLSTTNSLGIDKLVSLVVYAQILYGTHSIAECFDLSYLSVKEKFAFSLSRWVPFSIPRRRYLKALEDCKMVIANSKTTANLLQILYGAIVQGIVHPPVDTEVFKPSDHSKNPDGVTLYLGSRAGDTQISFVRKILSRIRERGYSVNLFGTERLSSILKQDFSELNYFADLDDSQVAELYSESLLTVCPQKWETFGLVPIESMACGTPVLAPNCMGFQETIINGRTGWLANNNNEFLGLLEELLASDSKDFSETVLRDYIIQNFSIPTCTDQLIASLRKHVVN